MDEILHGVQWIVIHGLPNFASRPPQRDGSNTKPREHDPFTTSQPLNSYNLQCIRAHMGRRSWTRIRLRSWSHKFLDHYTWRPVTKQNSSPLYTRAQRQEPSYWQGDSYTCLFTQIHFTDELSTCELELFTGIAMIRWHLYGPRVERSQQALHHFWQALGQNRKLPPWGSLGKSRAWALNLWTFKHSLAFHECSFI